MAKKSAKKAKKSARKTRPQAHRICNVVPSRNTQNDWGIEQAILAGALAGPAVAAAPVTAPASIDLRASWWGMGDQETDRVRASAGRRLTASLVTISSRPTD